MRPRLGISACLLGENVRYDGAHKRDAFLVEALAPCVEFVPVCPEVELGLGVPREPIRLERAEAPGETGRPRLIATRLIATESRRDLTEPMATFAAGRVAALEPLRLAGYVLKARSPSCGPGGVPIHGSERSGSGAFAAVLRARLPHLPIVHEETLARHAAREAFVAAVFTLARWFAVHGAAAPAGPEGLRTFVAQHRLLLISRDEHLLAELEALLRGAEPAPDEVLALVMTALARVPSPADHLHALQRAVDLLRPRLSLVEQAGLAGALDAYAGGTQPLSRPLAVVRGLAQRHGEEALLRSVYLEPHPPVLKLLDAI